MRASSTLRWRFHTIRGTRVGMTYAEAKRREPRPWPAGCWNSRVRRQHQVAGSWYAVVGGVYKGKRVHALHAFGPHPLLC